MPTYLIAEVNLKEPEAYSEYLSKVPKIISKYKGEYLIRGGKISHHEGNWRPNRGGSKIPKQRNGFGIL